MKEFGRAALIRAVRTFCQALIAAIGTTAVFTEVDWRLAGSTAALAAVLSILNSIATGLPEAPRETGGDPDE